MSPALVADVIPFSWVDGPGNRFTVFMQGCNFDCQACHNPQTIPLTSVHAKRETVESLVRQIRAAMPHISGVTVSGGEATLQADFVYSLFLELRSSPDTRHLTTFIDTNGSADTRTWDRLIPVTDGFMVDLKAWPDTLHEELTGHSNLQVLAAIRYLSEAERLYETRLMIAPGINDEPDDLTHIGTFLAGIDPNMRVKINHFHAHGTRSPASEWPEADDEQRRAYVELLKAGGVRNIY